MKKIIYILIILNSVNTLAQSLYSRSDLKVINDKSIINFELKLELQKIAERRQIPISYREARWYLYTNIYLEQDKNGLYFVKDNYCQKEIRKGAGPDSLPRSSKTNIEHTWPQSKFSNMFRKETQKTDLHHLYVVNSKANHLRGHQNFGEVQYYFDKTGTCQNAGLGMLMSVPSDVSWSSSDYYEPPLIHRGNIARSMFYFSIRYNLKINDTQEYFLRKWNKEDPITEIDKIRNDRIMSFQGNRNPFIDFPFLSERIDNF